jgi:uncharacterized membrane protein
MNMIPPLPLMDVVAIFWFVAGWLLYSYLLDHSALSKYALSSAMDRQRALWMHTMLQRDLRIVDTSIMAGLQQGTAFFASTSIFAIGGTFALLSGAEEVLAVFSHLPFAIEMTRAEWEFKILAMLLVYAYAFFKFGWAYRLFNYASMLVGAVPAKEQAQTAHARAAVESATQMTILAGTHFNKGLRAFFFAMGFLDWFMGPEVFMVSTTIVLLVLIRRQFFSASRRAAFRSLQQVDES